MCKKKEDKRGFISRGLYVLVYVLFLPQFLYVNKATGGCSERRIAHNILLFIASQRTSTKQLQEYPVRWLTWSHVAYMPPPVKVPKLAKEEATYEASKAFPCLQNPRGPATIEETNYGRVTGPKGP